MARAKAQPEIIEAVWKNDLAVIKALIGKGGNVNQRDGDGRTALMHATISGLADMVAWLLANGADPNIQDQNGWTALHFAAQDYRVEIARQLLAKHAQVDLRDKYGNTPLFKAVFGSNGRGELIHLLRSHGSDAHASNQSGVSPLQLARTIGNYDVKQYFDGPA